MGVLDRIAERAEISRALTLDQYLRQLGAQYGQYMPPVVSYGPTGQPTERPPVDFETLVAQTFATNPIIYGLVTKRGLIFSEARFMWQEMADGRGGDLRYDDGLALLEKPWPNGSTGEMLMRIDQDVSLAGNAYIVRERDRLRRLRPDWVQIVLSGNPLEEHDIDVVGYVYGAGSADSGNYKAYLPDEVAHISPVPDPLATYRGMSWLTPVIREVQADKQATEHKLNFLKNGAVLGPIVKAPPGISLEQFKKFIEAAESAHVGPQNAGRFLFLASGSDVSTVGADMRQIDFKALMGSAETRMTVAALMPAVIAGVSEGLQGSSLNAGNYQAAKRAFADGTLRPLWRILCAELETIVDVPEGSRLWFDETGVAFLREDQQDVAGIQAQQATTMNTLVTAGFEPKSIVTAVRENDWSKLKHTGLTSVQLSEPGSGGQNGDQSATDNSGDFAPDTQGQQDYQGAFGEATRARKVRTAAGVRFFDQPIGTVIVPDLAKAKHLDPEWFPGHIAARLHSGENAADLAGEFQHHARTYERLAADPDHENERDHLLTLAANWRKQADDLRTVQHLPLKPKTSPGPNPRPVPAVAVPEKPNPRTVPPAPLPSRPMTPAEQKLADDFAAGRISKAQLRAILTGKTPETFQPEETLAFVRGMVTAGYITELARTGDRDRLEAYLRRQNTVTLVAAAPFFGLHIPDNAGHDRIVALFHAQALKLEGPPPPPTRESLMSRKVVDLKASLRAAGLPVSGTKPVLVDRLLAAIQAATGGQS